MSPQFDTKDKLAYRRSFTPYRPQDAVVSLWPGKAVNLGTVARTCDAVGIKLYVLNSPEGKYSVKIGNVLGDKFGKIVKFIDHKINRIQYLRDKKEEGFQLVALELAEGAIDYRDFEYGITMPTLYFIGNERDGVPDEALDLMDEILVIPQCGRNGALNVATAIDIVLYTHNAPLPFKNESEIYGSKLV